MANGAHPPAVAFQNTLDHGNAGTSGYPQNPVCQPFHPVTNADSKPVTFGLVLLCRKNSSTHLHLTRKSCIS